MRLRGHTTQAAGVLSVAAAVAVRAAHDRWKTRPPEPVASPREPVAAPPPPPTGAERAVELPPQPGDSSTTSSFWFEPVRRAAAMPPSALVTGEPFALILDEPPGWGEADAFKAFRTGSGADRADEPDGPRVLVLDDSFTVLNEPFAELAAPPVETPEPEAEREPGDDDEPEYDPGRFDEPDELDDPEEDDETDEYDDLDDEPEDTHRYDVQLELDREARRAALPDTDEFEAYVPLRPPMWVSSRPVDVVAEGSWGWEERWSFERPGARRESRRTREARTTRKRARAAAGRARGRITLPKRGKPSGSLVRRSAVVLIAGLIATWLVAAYIHRPQPQSKAAAANAANDGFSAFGQRTVPAVYRKLYVRVGAEYGLDPRVLAAVGTIESRNGTSTAPGVTYGSNPAGASGPAQFLEGTWARYGVNVDGSGTADPYDPVDAITAMASYLKASGAPQNWMQALLTYNHSTVYAQSVLALAARLRS